MRPDDAERAREGQPLILCDIDGTLANHEHRVHYIEPPRRDWNTFYDAIPQDTPYPAIVRLVQDLAPSYRICLVTGRPERTRRMTEYWLDRHLVSYDALFMRPDGDHRPDTVVKAEILDGIDVTGVAFALEDRDRVVKMWRDEGITCLQVKEGNY